MFFWHIYINECQPISVSLFSHSVVSDSLRPHGLQHTRLPCPSPFPRVCSHSCLLSQWCHPTITSSVAPFCSCLQSFPVSGSFPMSCIKWQKYWSFSFSISPSSEYSGLISLTIDWFDFLAVQETLKSLQHHSLKASVLWCSEGNNNPLQYSCLENSMDGGTL